MQEGLFCENAYARLRSYMNSLLERLRRRLIPKEYRKLLQAIPQLPIQWDEAAVQLHQNRDHVRRTGYPQYLYGLNFAARAAKAAGEKQFVAIEFGVAGGNGLVAMEKHAELVEQTWGVKIDTVGCDMGSGMPERNDGRDCPFAFQGGEFAMDELKLRSRLRRSELILGDVADTVEKFTTGKFAPIGFVSNDLDLYTSSIDSFALFNQAWDALLPRVAIYCDDLIGYPYTTAHGEWVAIKEFNANKSERQIGQIYGLHHCLGMEHRFKPWTDMFFVLNVFDHERYNAPEVNNFPDLNLR